MTILYPVGNGLYVNITNRCPCACSFCIRNNGEGVYGSGSLWLEVEPTVDQVMEAFEAQDLDSFREIVFCGYGEPLERIHLVEAVCRKLRTMTRTPIRVNTNGLSDLIHGRPTASQLEGLVDCISISLNAASPQAYLEVTQPCFGVGSFDAMLRFAADCKKVIPKVRFTVVDVIPRDEIQRCQELADKMGIPLRVRKYES